MIKPIITFIRFLIFFAIFFGFNFSTIDKNFSIENAEAKLFCTTKTRNIEPGKASPPVCGFSMTLLAAVASALITALISWGTGRALAAIPPGLFPGSSALHKLGKMMMKFAKRAMRMALGIFIADTLGLMCLLTWVRYPVKRDSHGNYLKCKTPRDVIVGEGEEGTIDSGCPDLVYVSESEYHWPENSSDTSNFVEVCNDQYLPVMAAIPVIFSQLIQGTLYAVTEDVWWANDLYGSESSAFKGVKLIKAFLSLPSTRNCKVFRYNTEKAETGWVNGSYYKVKEAAGNSLCAYITDPIISLIEMETGCVLLDPAPPKPLCSASKPITDSEGVIVTWDDSPCISCFISLSCFDPNNSVSVHANTPILTSAISCLQGTLVSMVAGNDRCSNSVSGEYAGGDVFVNVIDKLKNAISAVILLSIILFGYRVYLGMIQSIAHYMMFIIKVAIVLYLTIGHGIIEVYEYLMILSSSFGNLVVSATSTLHGGLCGFEDTDPAWLSVWDKLDCRISLYLGLSIDFNIGLPIIGQVFLLPTTLLLDIFTGNFAMLIAFPIGLLSMIYGLILVLFMFWSMNLYVIALIAITVMIIMSPIFLLMWLFPYFEQTFHTWYKQIFGYALYPVLVLSFISLTFVVVDAFFFGDLSLEERTTQVSTGTRDWTTGEYIIRDVHNYILSDPSQCNGSDLALACFFTYNINYKMKNFFFGTEVTTSSLNYDRFGFSDFGTAFAKFCQAGFVVFIFYHFSTITASLVAELLGSFRADISDNSSPKESIQRVAAIAGYGASSGIEALRTRRKNPDNKDDRKSHDDKDDKNGNEGKENSKTNEDSNITSDHIKHHVSEDSARDNLTFDTQNKENTEFSKESDNKQNSDISNRNDATGTNDVNESSPTRNDVQSESERNSISYEDNSNNKNIIENAQNTIDIDPTIPNDNATNNEDKNNTANTSNRDEPNNYTNNPSNQDD